MKLFKVTEQDGVSGSLLGNKILWSDIVKNNIKKTSISETITRLYPSPLIASLVSDINNPRIFEVDAVPNINNSIIIGTWEHITIKKETDFINLTNIQKIEIAISVAKIFYKEEQWNSWADKWMVEKLCDARETERISYHTYTIPGENNFQKRYAAHCSAIAAHENIIDTSWRDYCVFKYSADSVFASSREARSIGISPESFAVGLHRIIEKTISNKN